MRLAVGFLVSVLLLILATGTAHARPIWLDMTSADVYDPSGHIDALTPASVTFESRDGLGDFTGLDWLNVLIPDNNEGALLFDIVTVLADGSDPKLGNVNVIVGLGPGLAQGVTVQGNFSGTLGINLRGYHGSVVPFISIGFPGSVYEAGEFSATVSNLRVPDTGSTLLLLATSLATLVGWKTRRVD